MSVRNVWNVQIIKFRKYTSPLMTIIMYDLMFKSPLISQEEDMERNK